MHKPIDKRDLFPDVAFSERPPHTSALRKVGMSGIEIPLVMDSESGEPPFRLLAQCEAYVSLDDPEAKGIHMSRLYLLAQEYLSRNPFDLRVLQDTLESFISSHEEISESAFLKLRFELPVLRSALKSGHAGYRFYPIEVGASYENDTLQFEIKATVTYSSTCPCSAALARQLIQEKFKEDFSGSQDKIDKDRVISWLGQETSILATPHSQRSHATLHCVVKNHKLDLLGLIDHAEKVVGTPVQAAVKREDEQEFARLNGQNLMFSEDSARRLDAALSELDWVEGYRIRVDHFESLHPHDAVAEAESPFWSRCRTLL